MGEYNGFSEYLDDNEVNEDTGFGGTTQREYTDNSVDLVPISEYYADEEIRDDNDFYDLGLENTRYAKNVFLEAVEKDRINLELTKTNPEKFELIENQIVRKTDDGKQDKIVKLNHNTNLLEATVAIAKEKGMTYEQYQAYNEVKAWQGKADSFNRLYEKNPFSEESKKYKAQAEYYESKIAPVKEMLGGDIVDKAMAFDAYYDKHGYHPDASWLEQGLGTVSDTFTSVATFLADSDVSDAKKTYEELNEQFEDSTLAKGISMDAVRNQLAEQDWADIAGTRTAQNIAISTGVGIATGVVGGIASRGILAKLSYAGGFAVSQTVLTAKDFLNDMSDMTLVQEAYLRKKHNLYGSMKDGEKMEALDDIIMQRASAKMDYENSIGESTFINRMGTMGLEMVDFMTSMSVARVVEGSVIKGGKKLLGKKIGNTSKELLRKKALKEITKKGVWNSKAAVAWNGLKQLPASLARSVVHPFLMPVKTSDIAKSSYINRVAQFDSNGNLITSGDGSMGKDIMEGYRNTAIEVFTETGLDGFMLGRFLGEGATTIGKKLLPKQLVMAKMFKHKFGDNIKGAVKLFDDIKRNIGNARGYELYDGFMGEVIEEVASAGIGEMFNRTELYGDPGMIYRGLTAMKDTMTDVDMLVFMGLTSGLGKGFKYLNTPNQDVVIGEGKDKLVYSKFAGKWKDVNNKEDITDPEMIFKLESLQANQDSINERRGDIETIFELDDDVAKYKKEKGVTEESTNEEIKYYMSQPSGIRFSLLEDKPATAKMVEHLLTKYQKEYGLENLHTSVPSDEILAKNGFANVESMTEKDKKEAWDLIFTEKDEVIALSRAIGIELPEDFHRLTPEGKKQAIGILSHNNIAHRNVSWFNNMLRISNIREKLEGKKEVQNPELSDYNNMERALFFSDVLDHPKYDAYAKEIQKAKNLTDSVKKVQALEKIYIQQKKDESAELRGRRANGDAKSDAQLKGLEDIDLVFDAQIVEASEKMDYGPLFDEKIAEIEAERAKRIADYDAKMEAKRDKLAEETEAGRRAGIIKAVLRKHDLRLKDSLEKVTKLLNGDLSDYKGFTKEQKKAVKDTVKALKKRDILIGARKVYKETVKATKKKPVKVKVEKKGQYNKEEREALFQIFMKSNLKKKGIKLVREFRKTGDIGPVVKAFESFIENAKVIAEKSTKDKDKDDLTQGIINKYTSLLSLIKRFKSEFKANKVAEQKREAKRVKSTPVTPKATTEQQSPQPENFYDEVDEVDDMSGLDMPVETESKFQINGVSSESFRRWSKNAEFIENNSSIDLELEREKFREEYLDITEGNKIIQYYGEDLLRALKISDNFIDIMTVFSFLDKTLPLNDELKAIDEEPSLTNKKKRELKKNLSEAYKINDNDISFLKEFSAKISQNELDYNELKLVKISDINRFQKRLRKYNNRIKRFRKKNSSLGSGKKNVYKTGKSFVTKLFHGNIKGSIEGDVFNEEYISANTEYSTGGFHFSQSAEAAYTYSDYRNYPIKYKDYNSSTKAERAEFMKIVQSRYMDLIVSFSTGGVLDINGFINENPHIYEAVMGEVLNRSIDLSDNKVTLPQEFYVNLQNPSVFDMKGKFWDIQIYQEKIDLAKKNGNDGIVFINVKDALKDVGEDNVVIVFPEYNDQIKSASKVDVLPKPKITATRDIKGRLTYYKLDENGKKVQVAKASVENIDDVHVTVDNYVASAEDVVMYSIGEEKWDPKKDIKYAENGADRSAQSQKRNAGIFQETVFSVFNDSNKFNEVIALTNNKIFKEAVKNQEAYDNISGLTPREMEAIKDLKLGDARSLISTYEHQVNVPVVRLATDASPHLSEMITIKNNANVIYRVKGRIEEILKREQLSVVKEKIRDVEEVYRITTGKNDIENINLTATTFIESMGKIFDTIELGEEAREYIRHKVYSYLAKTEKVKAAKKVVRNYMNQLEFFRDDLKKEDVTVDEFINILSTRPIFPGENTLGILQAITSSSSKTKLSNNYQNMEKSNVSTWIQDNEVMRMAKKEGLEVVKIDSFNFKDRGEVDVNDLDQYELEQAIYRSIDARKVAGYEDFYLPIFQAGDRKNFYAIKYKFQTIEEIIQNRKQLQTDMGEFRESKKGFNTMNAKDIIKQNYEYRMAETMFKLGGKLSQYKDFNDFVKRGSNVFSDGYTLVQGLEEDGGVKEHYKHKILSDDNFTEELKNVWNEINAGNSMKIMDGITFVTRKFMNQIGVSLGSKLTDKFSFDDISTLKMIYAGKNDNGLDERGLTKSNWYVLEDMAEISPAIAKLMESVGDNDVISFVSGSKVQETLDKDGSIMRPTRNLLFQTDLRQNGDHNKLKKGSVQWLFNNLNFKNIDKMNKIQENILKNNLAKFLGLEKDHGMDLDEMLNIEMPNDSYFRKRLIREIKSSDSNNPALIDFINSDEFDFNNPLLKPTLATTLRGIAEKELISNQSNRAQLIAVPDFDGTLKPARKDGAGRMILGEANASVPMTFRVREDSAEYETKNDAIDHIMANKEEFIDLFDSNGNFLDQEIEEHDGVWLINGNSMLATRVPADTMHSHHMVRVVKRLKNDLSAIQVTREYQFVSGEDFDGDQRHTAFRISDPHSDNDVLYNEYFKLMQDNFYDVDNMAEITTEVNLKFFENHSILKPPVQLPPFNTMNAYTTSRAGNLVGKDLLEITANWIGIVRYMQLEDPENAFVKDEDRIILEAVGSLTNLSADNAKLQILARLGLTKENFNDALSIALSDIKFKQKYRKNPTVGYAIHKMKQIGRDYSTPELVDAYRKEISDDHTLTKTEFLDSLERAIVIANEIVKMKQDKIGKDAETAKNIQYKINKMKNKEDMEIIKEAKRNQRFYKKMPVFYDATRYNEAPRRNKKLNRANDINFFLHNMFLTNEAKYIPSSVIDDFDTDNELWYKDKLSKVMEQVGVEDIAGFNESAELYKELDNAIASAENADFLDKFCDEHGDLKEEYFDGVITKEDLERAKISFEFLDAHLQEMLIGRSLAKYKYNLLETSKSLSRILPVSIIPKIGRMLQSRLEIDEIGIDNNNIFHEIGADEVLITRDSEWEGKELDEEWELYIDDMEQTSNILVNDVPANREVVKYLDKEKMGFSFYSENGEIKNLIGIERDPVQKFEIDVVQKDHFRNKNFNRNYIQSSININGANYEIYRVKEGVSDLVGKKGMMFGMTKERQIFVNVPESINITDAFIDYLKIIFNGSAYRTLMKEYPEINLNDSIKTEEDVFKFIVGFKESDGDSIDRFIMGLEFLESASEIDKTDSFSKNTSFYAPHSFNILNSYEVKFDYTDKIYSFDGKTLTIKADLTVEELKSIFKDRVVQNVVDTLVGDKALNNTTDAKALFNLAFYAKQQGMELAGYLNKYAYSYLRDPSRMAKFEPLWKQEYNEQAIKDLIKGKFNLEVEFYDEIADKVKGQFVGGKIMLSRKMMTEDTPIHEAMHAFVDLAKEQNPKLYKGLIRDVKNLSKQKKYAKVVATYTDIYKGDSVKINDEVLVHALTDQMMSVTKSDRNTFLKKLAEIFNKFLQKLMGIKAIHIDSNIKEVASMFVSHNFDLKQDGTQDIKQSRTIGVTTATEEMIGDEMMKAEDIIKDLKSYTVFSNAKKVSKHADLLRIRFNKKVDNVQRKDKTNLHEAIMLRANTKLLENGMFENENENTPNQHIIKLAKDLRPDELAIVDELHELLEVTYDEFATTPFGKVEHYFMQRWHERELSEEELEYYQKSDDNGNPIHSQSRKYANMIDAWNQDEDLTLYYESIGEAVQFYYKSMKTAFSNNAILKAGIEDGIFKTEYEEGYKPILALGTVQNEKYGTQIVSSAKKDSMILTNEILGEQLYQINTKTGESVEFQYVYAPAKMADEINRMTRFDKGLRGRNGFIDALFWVNRVLKTMMIQLSFFHHYAFARSYYFAGVGISKDNGWIPWVGYKLGKKMLKEYSEMTEEQLLEKGRLSDARLIHMMVEIGGLNIFQDEIDIEKYGLPGMGFLDKLPIAKQVIQLSRAWSKFLFKDVGGAFKTRVAVLELRHAMEKFEGKYDIDKLVMGVANTVNNDFGGIDHQLNTKIFGIKKRTKMAQDVFTLLTFAPDWTESNFNLIVDAFKPGTDELNKHLARSILFRATVRTVGATVILNLLTSALMGAGDDDKKWYSQFMKFYKEAWRSGRLKWLEGDVTPIYQALGYDEEEAKGKTYSVGGHFFDAFKLLPDVTKAGNWFEEMKDDPINFVTMSNTVQYSKHKSSHIAKMMISMITGKDYTGKRTYKEFGDFSFQDVLKGKLAGYGNKKYNTFEGSKRVTSLTGYLGQQLTSLLAKDYLVKEIKMNYDGDTFTASMYGYNNGKPIRLRILGYDSYEMKSSKNKRLAKQGKKWLNNQLKQGDISVRFVGTGYYGRPIVDVYTKGESLRDKALEQDFMKGGGIFKKLPDAGKTSDFEESMAGQILMSVVDSTVRTISQIPAIATDNFVSSLPQGLKIGISNMNKEKTNWKQDAINFVTAGH